MQQNALHIAIIVTAPNAKLRTVWSIVVCVSKSNTCYCLVRLEDCSFYHFFFFVYRFNDNRMNWDRKKLISNECQSVCHIHYAAVQGSYLSNDATREVPRTRAGLNDRSLVLDRATETAYHSTCVILNLPSQSSAGCWSRTCLPRTVTPGHFCFQNAVQWLKCNETQGNAVSPPPIYASKRSPTSDCYNAIRKGTRPLSGAQTWM